MPTKSTEVIRMPKPFLGKINLYRFYTVYGEGNRKTYKILSGVNSGLHKEENTDLTDLFFDDDSVQSFELSHGYRAQTHLGSLLMYHGIIEAARNISRNGESASNAEKISEIFSIHSCQNKVQPVFSFSVLSSEAQEPHLYLSFP